MEELKLLVDMVAHLPQMALWVVVMFFIYKMGILASAYATIRFCVQEFVRYGIARKTIKDVKEVELRTTLDGIVITGNTDALILQLRRLVGISSEFPGSLTFIHGSDISWLARAIDDKIEKDRLAKENKKSIS